MDSIALAQLPSQVATEVPASTWPATLALQFSDCLGRTVMTRRHSGPLQVQKSLYPEGDHLCHAILLHPPGGIAGGDQLTISVDMQAGASALITTPGATRWYKANGRRATQSVSLRVAGSLEWLPQEAIVFNSADVDSRVDIDVAENAAMLGWDIVALGRGAAGESFSDGHFAQTIRLRQSGRLIWVERTRIAGGDALLDSPIGLAGRRVFGCFWAVGPHWQSEQIDLLRAALALPEEARNAAAANNTANSIALLTCLAPRLLLARVLGASTQGVRRALEAIWRELRPLTFAGRAAQAPRIWAT